MASLTLGGGYLFAFPRAVRARTLTDRARQQEEHLDVARHPPRDHALVAEGLDERNVPAHESGHSLGHHLLVGGVVEAKELGQDPRRRVDGERGVDVPRVDAFDMYRAALA